MADETVYPEPEQPDSPYQPPTLLVEPLGSQPKAPPAPQKPSPKKRGWWWVLLPILVGIVGLIGCGLCSLIFLPIMLASNQTGEIDGVLNQFMEALEQQQIDVAYSLISPRGKNSITQDDLSGMIAGSNYVLVEGFERVEVTESGVHNSANTDPTTPDGIYAEVSGTTFYSAGHTGSFNAIMEREGDTWLIHSFNISVPPEN